MPRNAPSKMSLGLYLQTESVLGWFCGKKGQSITHWGAFRLYAFPECWNCIGGEKI